IGNALEIIPGMNFYFDLVFIDGDKREYSAYYKIVIDKVKPGGFILVDNVLWDGKVIEKNESGDPYTQGIKAFNKLAHNDPRVEVWGIVGFNIISVSVFFPQGKVQAGIQTLSA
ncbi:unnamed protein product, partial [marine sediment metagenome]